jgi:hypothetical protein
MSTTNPTLTDIGSTTGPQAERSAANSLHRDTPWTLRGDFKKARFIRTRPVLFRCIKLSHCENCLLYESINPKTSSNRKFVRFDFSFLIKHLHSTPWCFFSDKTYWNNRILYLLKRSSGCRHGPYFSVPLFPYSSCWCRIVMAVCHQC